MKSSSWSVMSSGVRFVVVIWEEEFSSRIFSLDGPSGFLDTSLLEDRFSPLEKDGFVSKIWRFQIRIIQISCTISTLDFYVTNKHETKHIHRYLLSSNITFRKESRVWQIPFYHQNDDLEIIPKIRLLIPNKPELGKVSKQLPSPIVQ